MGKCLVLLLIAVLTLSSLTMAKSAFAQSIPKPSVPEFTIEYMNQSYVTPRLEIFDLETGHMTGFIPSVNFDQPTILFTIKNQVFNGTLYYNFRYRIAGQDSWNYYPFKDNITTHAYGLFTSGNTSPAILVIDSMIAGQEYSFIPINFTVPYGGTAEVQVQALYGSINPIEGSVPKTPYGETDFYFQFSGTASDWSNTQTITIYADGSFSVSSSPASTPDQTTNVATQTLQLAAFTGTIAIVIVSVGLLVYFKKRKHQD